MPDQYNAVWVSHSSISDYLQCPRAYFLKNVYKDPKTGHKLTMMSPSLALGQSIHAVLESLSQLPVTERFMQPLPEKFEAEWQKVSGIKGGFFDEETEQKFKRRGQDMIARVYNNPGPLQKLAVKLDQDLPHYWLSEEDEIILCGKIDWLEYLPDTDSVNIIDFKTGQKEEDTESLQLPIYLLLVHNCQRRIVSQASYWYLERDDAPSLRQLPTIESAHESVLVVAQKIKLARQLKKFDCRKENGCFACQPFEKIIQGEAQFVGSDSYNRDIYVFKREEQSIQIGEGTLL